MKRKRSFGTPLPVTSNQPASAFPPVPNLFGACNNHNGYADSQCHRERKVIKKDVVAIRDKTLDILMGRRKQDAKRKEIEDFSLEKENMAKLGLEESSLTMATCNVCASLRDCAGCTFCSRSVCLNCARRCDACNDVFCSFCSMLNYDKREVRAFCLGCPSH